MRKTGYSTRLVDRAIQSLFKYGWVRFVTHNQYKRAMEGRSHEEREHCLLLEQLPDDFPYVTESNLIKICALNFETMKRRLLIEHEHLSKQFQFNSDLSIRIKDFPKNVFSDGEK